MPKKSWLRNLLGPDRRIAQQSIAEKRYILSETCQIPGLAGIYKDHFGFRTDGTFVEVGAFDGDYVSNTSGLADIGWRGFYVEPVPSYFRKCRRRHRRNPNVTVSNLAIGDKETETEIFVGGALSTIDPDMVELFDKLKWAKGHHRGKAVKVKQITLEQHLQQQGVEPGFEVLSVDVEGFEWHVLTPFDLGKWAPRMVLVELHDDNDEYMEIRDKCIAVRECFERAGYNRIYRDKSNSVFVHPDLRKA